MSQAVTQMPVRQHVKRAKRHPIDPRVRRITIRSKALGIAKSFYVAVPPGYHRAANRDRRYPTIYLFRGHEHEWVHRWQDKSRRGRTVIDVYRELLEQRKVGPIIMIFPGISSDDNRVPGLLVNFRRPELAVNEPGIGTGRFDDYFFEELIPYIDSHYRTINKRTGRAVDGFSLGGFQSIKAASARPDLFCSAGAFDGTFLYATDRGRSVRKTDRVLRNPMFAPAFGSPPDLNFVAENSPTNLIWRGDHEALAAVQWMIRSGPETAEPWQSNFYRAQHLISVMSTRKLKNAVPPVLQRAKHNWSWADRHLQGTLPLHWSAFGIEITEGIETD